MTTRRVARQPPRIEPVRDKPAPGATPTDGRDHRDGEKNDGRACKPGLWKVRNV